MNRNEHEVCLYRTVERHTRCDNLITSGMRLRKIKIFETVGTFLLAMRKTVTRS